MAFLLPNTHFLTGLLARAATLLSLAEALLASFVVWHSPYFARPAGIIGFALMLAVSASPRLSFAEEFENALRPDLQRPVDARLSKIETLGIAGSRLFQGAAHIARSAADVRALSGKLKPGEQLVLTGAEWRDTRFTFEGHGTADSPILIRPEKPGGVVFRGDAALVFHGEHLVVHDLAFRGVRPSRNNAVILSASNGAEKPADDCLFNRLHFEDCGSTNPDDWPKLRMWFMNMRGKDNTVANSTFDGLRNIGQMLGAAELPTNGLQRQHVLNNRFTNRPKIDDQNGYEVLQIGWSGERAAATGSLIEGNTFERCDGENELITLKASDIVVRDNRFIASQGVLSLRAANRVLVRDNVFDGQGRENTGGITVEGADHVILGNTFRNLRKPRNYYFWPLALLAASSESYGDNGDVAGYGRAKNILIAGNRFEGCDARIAIGAFPRKEYPLLPRNIQVRDNVFTGTNAGSPFDYIAPDPTGELPKELHETGNNFLP